MRFFPSERAGAFLTGACKRNGGKGETSVVRRVSAGGASPEDSAQENADFKIHHFFTGTTGLPLPLYLKSIY